VQLAIRLLIPARSKLLELPEIRERVGELDGHELSYRWNHGDPAVERLYESVRQIVAEKRNVDGKHKSSRTEIFSRVWAEAAKARRKVGAPQPLRPAQKSAANGFSALAALPARACIPYLNEPWFC
jgi:hypothetical protein